MLPRSVKTDSTFLKRKRITKKNNADSRERKDDDKKGDKERNVYSWRALFPCCHLLSDPKNSPTFVRVSVKAEWQRWNEVLRCVRGLRPRTLAQYDGFPQDLKNLCNVFPFPTPPQSCLLSFLSAYFQITSLSSSLLLFLYPDLMLISQLHCFIHN